MKQLSENNKIKWIRLIPLKPFSINKSIIFSFTCNFVLLFLLLFDTGLIKEAKALSIKENILIDDTTNWIPVNSGVFTVNGLWWFKENAGSYYRLPERARKIAQLNPRALTYSEYPAGGRVRFKTNSSTLSVRIDHGGDPFNWKELSIMAMAGIELYEGKPEQMIFRGITRPESGRGPYIFNFSTGSDKKIREYSLYLPMYSKLKVLELKLDQNARIEPPSPFVLPRPVVFYGSSFIQGGCASRPSMNLPAIVGRKLGVDIINLGFAGDGTYEPEMAGLMAEIDAACFIIGPILNDTMLTQKNYFQFVSNLRKQRPDCPILLMTRLQTLGQTEPFAVNTLVRNIYEKMRKSGDKKVYYFDSFVLYQDGSIHPTAEGLHPSDLGFTIIADSLTPLLAKILDISAK